MLPINEVKRVWEKIELYIISLWLLFFLIIVITIDIPVYFGEDWYFIGWGELARRNILALISLVFLIIGMILVSRFKYKLAGSTRSPFKITRIENINYEHLTFLTTYIIPLICFNFSNLRYVVTLFLLLFIIGAIYVKTNMFYANPSLALLGYHIYRVDGNFRTGKRDNIIIISRQQLNEGMRVSYLRLDEKIYYVRVIK